MYVRYGKPFMVDPEAKGESFDAMLGSVGEKLLALRKEVRVDAGVSTVMAPASSSSGLVTRPSAPAGGTVVVFPSPRSVAVSFRRSDRFVSPSPDPHRDG